MKILSWIFFVLSVCFFLLTILSLALVGIPILVCFAFPLLLCLHIAQKLGNPLTTEFTSAYEEAKFKESTVFEKGTGNC